MNHPGWSLVVIGSLLMGVGLLWIVLPFVPWLGKLPGDIAIERGNFQFYFPAMTCILLSVVVTGIMWVVRFFSR